MIIIKEYKAVAKKTTTYQIRKKTTTYQIRICKYCGNEFTSEKYRGNITCSLKCAHKYRAEIYREIFKKNKKIIKCKYCNKEFLDTKNSTRKYCSFDCVYKDRLKERIEVNCGICGKKIMRIKEHVKEHSFCSLQCTAKFGLMKIGESRKYTKTKPELKFEELLKKNKIKYELQKRVAWKHGWWKFYDFYIPEKKLLIEIDGIYWHGKNLDYKHLNNQQKQTRNNDIVKNNLAKERDYNLLRIWEDEIADFNINKINK